MHWENKLLIGLIFRWFCCVNFLFTIVSILLKLFLFATLPWIWAFAIPVMITLIIFAIVYVRAVVFDIGIF